MNTLIVAIHGLTEIFANDSLLVPEVCDHVQQPIFRLFYSLLLLDPVWHRATRVDALDLLEVSAKYIAVLVAYGLYSEVIDVDPPKHVPSNPLLELFLKLIVTLP